MIKYNRISVMALRASVRTGMPVVLVFIDYDFALGKWDVRDVVFRRLHPCIGQLIR